MRIFALYDTMDLPETALINGIAASGVEVVVAANSERGFAGQLSSDISRVIELRCASRLDRRAIALLKSELLRTEFDIIHAYTGRTLSAALFASRTLKNPPKILGYRGAIGNVSWFDPTAWISFRHPRVAGIFCVSKAVQESLLKDGFKAEKLAQIYKGHDTNWYRSKPARKREEFGIPDSAFVVCCIANMRPNKGLDDLLTAATLLENEKEIHFLLVGEMQELEALGEFKSLAKKDRLHQLGYQSDVAGILQITDCLVVPTKYVEGFPKTAIEAMSLEVPVIVTRVGGMPELVRDGKDGLQVAPCHPQELAEAIASLAGDQKRAATLGRAGRIRIETSFPVEKTISETLEWYRSFF